MIHYTVSQEKISIYFKIQNPIIGTTKKRVLLIAPPFYALYDSPSYRTFPLGLSYLAASIKQNSSWDVLLYDADFAPDLDIWDLTSLKHEGFERYLDAYNDRSHRSWEAVRSVISQYGPDVVGITATAPTFKSAMITARIAKEVSKDTIVIVGGSHPTIMGEEVFSDQPIDVSVIGEGEVTFIEVLHAIDEGRSFEGIRGIIFRTGQQVQRNPPRELIPDLDSLPLPVKNDPRILYHNEQYPNNAFRSIMATRGCPNRCFFCSSRHLWGQRVRYRSPEQVVREIRELQSMGLQAIHFEDDFFGVRKDYLRSLCGTIKTECPGLQWSCQMHVRMIDDVTISQMKESGCFSISLGIESGNDVVLKQLRKNITVEDALRACRLIKKHGIALNTYFIIGTPFETEESLRDTMSLIQEIPCDSITCNTFTPYPGTEAFVYCKDLGLIPDDYDPSLYFHQSPRNCFTPHIKPEIFYMLVEEINNLVDRINMRKKFHRIFSFSTLRTFRQDPLKIKLKLFLRVLWLNIAR
jgi:anaerobic magnesium-protoporphyrin IX monomethyl ester cyclase